MKTQIERLRNCAKEILDKVEILISDNCSTDDTQEIVKKAMSEGFCCRYIRNSRNLGMDGNFVNCFRSARGKYVWLLGDDDFIIPESLQKIVEKLDLDDDYGLIHIEMNKNLNEPNFVEYFNDDLFCKKISFWFTFISGNICRTKYVKDIPFEKYMGTWFTLIPLYFKSLHEEKKNLMINFTVFEDSKDIRRNGGYNFFEVFVSNYLNLLDEFVRVGYIQPSTKYYLKKDIYIRYTIGFINRLLVHKEKSNLKSENGWKIVHSYYKNEIYYYSTIPRLIYLNLKNVLKQ